MGSLEETDPPTKDLSVHLMALRDRDWPAYTQWFCCLACNRLWTYQGNEVIALAENYTLGPAMPSEGVPERTCFLCDGVGSTSLLEI